MERRVSLRQVWLVVPSPVRGPRYERHSGHLFQLRRQSIAEHRILINVVDNTRTVTPVPSDVRCPSRHP